MNRQDIVSNLDNPAALEKMYRDNKRTFKSEFGLLYPELTGNKIAEFWKERLDYESTEISWGSKKDWIFVLLVAVLAGTIAKLPAILNLNKESFYQRNIGLIVFPALAAFFAWKNRLLAKRILIAAAIFLISAVFINWLPADNKSDTLNLACIHLPLFLWAVLGFVFAGENLRSLQRRLDFLRYNGDLVIMSALILIAGGILSGVTIGLFGFIGINIEKIYTDYILVYGLSALPVVATFITQTNPQLVNRVSPVIAKIFSPLVLIMLVAYLIAILYSGKNPYRDREFLLVFNLLLIGVMAIIFFSVAETFKKSENRAGSVLLLALSVVTAIVNGIALSAIVFRISEWGLSPNRLAVLGGDILILTNLLIIAYRLFRNLIKKGEIREVENAISFFLPVYAIWTVVVTFAFPLVFQFI